MTTNMVVVGELRARIPSCIPPLWLLVYLMLYVSLIAVTNAALPSPAAFRLKEAALRCHL